MMMMITVAGYLEQDNHHQENIEQGKVDEKFIFLNKNIFCFDYHTKRIEIFIEIY